MPELSPEAFELKKELSELCLSVAAKRAELEELKDKVRESEADALKRVSASA